MTTVQRRGRQALAVSALLLALVGDASSMRASVPLRVQTLARPTHRVDAFAQDGRGIAWIERWNLSEHMLSVRPAGTGRTRRARFLNEGKVIGLAVASGRAIWALVWGGTDSSYSDVWTAAVGDPRVVRFGGEQGFVTDTCGEGEEVSSVAGDGRVLLYSTLEWGKRGNDLEGDACVDGLELRGGSVDRVLGRRAEQLIAAPAATLAVAGDRVAVVVASSRGTGRSVEIRSLAGERLTTLTPSADVASVAISARFVGVGVGRWSSDRSRWTMRRLEFYDAGTGELRTVVPLRAGAGRRLSISGTTATFADGRKIRAVDITSGRVRTLATAAAAPVGLSILGRRVAWAESAGCDRRGTCKRARIRAVMLPAV